MNLSIGLIFSNFKIGINKMNNANEVYNAISADYEDYSSRKTPYLASIENIVISEMKGRDGILDIGTGDGRRFQKLINALNLNDYLAIEPSAEMVELCEKRGVPVKQSSVEDISNVITRTFDGILALWNVLGHIPTGHGRLNALKQIHSKLNNGGVFFCDLNNRHNMHSYGYLKVLGRVILDTIKFDEKRGDAHYTWNINGKSYKGFGHLFTPMEAEKLFADAGFIISQCWAVNYESGQISNNKYRGQLLFKLEKK
jgi:SAM-dependent methyltransferase